jgi:hypothetical protein
LRKGGATHDADGYRHPEWFETHTGTSFIEDSAGVAVV